MSGHDKDLLTDLRTVRNRHGATAFDAAIKALVDGEITLQSGKRGRPGIPTSIKRDLSWVQVRALMDLHGVSDHEAAEQVAQDGMTFMTWVDGPGGQRVPREPRMKSQEDILKNYRAMESLYKENETARKMFDEMLASFKRCLTYTGGKNS